MRQVEHRFDIARQHAQSIWEIQYRIVPIVHHGPFRYTRFDLKKALRHVLIHFHSYEW
jgi:hypothetical protein